MYQKWNLIDFFTDKIIKSFELRYRNPDRDTVINVAEYLAEHNYTIENICWNGVGLNLFCKKVKYSHYNHPQNFFILIKQLEDEYDWGWCHGY